MESGGIWPNYWILTQFCCNFTLEDQNSIIILRKFLKQLVFPHFSLKLFLQSNKILTIWQNIVIINVCSIFSINQYNMKAVGNKNILRTFEPQNSIWIRTLSLRSNLDVLIRKRVYITMAVGRSVITSRFWEFRAKRRADFSYCPCPATILPLPTRTRLMQPCFTFRVQ